MVRGFLLRALIMAALAGPAAARAHEPACDVPAVLDLTLNTTALCEIRALLAAAPIWADVGALQAPGLVNARGLCRVHGDRVYVAALLEQPPSFTSLWIRALLIPILTDDAPLIPHDHVYAQIRTPSN